MRYRGMFAASPEEKKLLTRVVNDYISLNLEQQERVSQIMRSWGVRENWYGIQIDRARRRAIKLVRNNYP